MPGETPNLELSVATTSDESRNRLLARFVRLPAQPIDRALMLTLLILHDKLVVFLEVKQNERSVGRAGHDHSAVFPRAKGDAAETDGGLVPLGYAPLIICSVEALLKGPDLEFSIVAD